MKKKSLKAVEFIEDLYYFISKHNLLRKDTRKFSETDIQREIRALIIDYLKKYWKGKNLKDYEAKAYSSFYWEGQEGSFGSVREPTFGARNYPDFIIKSPYNIAIEYKQSDSGSLIKHGIGQSLIHTMSDDFDFVLLIFKDQNQNDKIAASLKNDKEQKIISKLWDDFNVMVKILPFKNER
jgi:hypothetical protein